MRKKLIRITTVPLSLEKLLEGQLTFMQDYYNVTAICSEKERLQKFGKENQVAIFFVNLTRKITPVDDLLAVFKIYKYLKKEKPMIVHTHTPKAGVVGMFAAYLARVPIRLHTVAGLPLMEETGLKRSLLDAVEKLTYRFATMVYPNSKGLYDFIVSQRFTSPSKLHIIGNGSSNGIDTSYFDPTLFSEADNLKLKESLKIPSEDFVYIFIGRLVKDKGINELTRAFANLSETKKNISLLLVGHFEEDLDPLLDETMKTISSNPKIFSVGYQIDVRPYFAISNTLVFPSYREGFPNVVMQTGAMGLPVIVTNINGCNEIISHYRNGLIVPVKDEVKLLDAMTEIVENKVLLSNLKQNARRTITDSYERTEIWSHLLKEYRRLEAKL